MYSLFRVLEDGSKELVSKFDSLEEAQEACGSIPEHSIEYFDGVSYSVLE